MEASLTRSHELTAATARAQVNAEEFERQQQLRRGGSSFMTGVRVDEPALRNDSRLRGIAGVPIMATGSQPTSWFHPKRIGGEVGWLKATGPGARVSSKEVEAEVGPYYMQHVLPSPGPCFRSMEPGSQPVAAPAPAAP